MRYVLWITWLSSTCLNGFSQSEKNVIVLELAGKSYYFFDLSYERSLSEKLHLGMGAGMGQIQSYYEWQYGRIMKYNVRIPVYGAYTFGLKKHNIITECGVTFLTTILSRGDSDTSVLPFISCGYQFKGTNIIFRVPCYLFYLSENRLSLPVMLWAGVTIGVPF